MQHQVFSLPNYINSSNKSNNFQSKITQDASQSLNIQAIFYFIFTQYLPSCIHIRICYATINIRYLQILNSKMDTFIDSCSYNQQKLAQHKYSQTTLSLFAKDPVDQFLNHQAFVNEHHQIHQILEIKQASKSETLEEQPESQAVALGLLLKRKKSIFHNFQKHLITLLKKFIILNENEATNAPQRQLAKNMWLAFKKTRCYNKKCLHMLFGVAPSTPISQSIQAIAQQQSQSQSIQYKNSIKNVLQAQAFIRQQIVRQASFLTKQFLEQKCQMSRFQEFFQYFKCFICELSQGPMTKRMTKIRKHIVVQNLMNAVHN